MFKRSSHYVALAVDLPDGKRASRKALKDGWVFALDGREFFLWRQSGRWKVSDIGTGMGLYASGATRGEAAAIFERSYYAAYLRTVCGADYLGYVEAFDRMPMITA